MKCSSCKQEAQYRCECQQQYRCAPCFVKHLTSIGNHSHEDITLVHLDDQRLAQIKSELQNKIQQIKVARFKICSSSNLLISTITRLQNNAVNELETLNQKYLDLLERKCFYQSDIEILRDIENTEIAVISIDFRDIEYNIKKIYDNELVSVVDKSKNRINRFLTWNLGVLNFRNKGTINNSNIRFCMY